MGFLVVYIHKNGSLKYHVLRKYLKYSALGLVSLKVKGRAFITS
jgi:hypothetical protein